MILTIDVGLKNLAFCIMSSDDKKKIECYTIHLWEIINTLDESIPNCVCLTKKGSICGKNSTMKYIKDGELNYTCKTHFPKDRDIKMNNTIKRSKVKEFLLQDIALVVIRCIDEIYTRNKEIFEQLTKIHIELQPKINNKMKLVSHIIYGKLVDIFQQKESIQIRFIRAAQKLKAYNGPPIECNLKSDYSKRKFLSIEYTKWILQNLFNATECDKWYNFFIENKKKDDLADVYLMAINAVKH